MNLPVGIWIAVAAVVAGGAGWLIGFLMGRHQAPPGDNRLEAELRSRAQQRENELNETRRQLSQTAEAKAAAEAKLGSAERMLVETRDLYSQNLKAAKDAQDKALADLREAFKALSADALKESAPQFLQLAQEAMGKFQESAKGDLKQRQEAIAGLVQPLKEQLETYQRRLQQSENTQATALGEVKKQLEGLSQNSQALSSETFELRQVLRSNQARGRWGEETLRRVVEAAGMSPHCDFQEQTQSGDAKPDLTVRLPGGRMIIVDAKAPDLDALRAAETADPARRAESLAAHAAKLKSTIKALAERDYPRQFPGALDFVVLFLPAESLFSAALEGDADLIVWAAEKRILLATPATLIGLLRAVGISWQQHSQNENAREIAALAQELFKRIVTFMEHFAGIRDGLNKATGAYDAAVGSYERMVRPSGERLVKMSGGAGAKALPEIEELNTTLRLPPAPPPPV